MTFNPSTALQSLKNSADGFRDVLILDAQEGKDSEQLAKSVNDLAKAEGRVHVGRTASSALEDGVTLEAIRSLRRWLERELVRGPQDTWSGRANDSRRAYFEGVAAQAGSVLDYLEAQERKILGGGA